VAEILTDLVGFSLISPVGPSVRDEAGVRPLFSRSISWQDRDINIDPPSTQADARPGPDRQSVTAGAGRRSYDSPVRRTRQAETRERIVTAGSDLVHGFQEWDWRQLTFRAVADRAGVSERTVYRYFANERELHDAVMARLHQDAGVSYEDLELDGLVEIADTIFSSLSTFAARYPPTEPAFPQFEQRRRDAVAGAIEGAAEDWSESDRRIAMAALDVAWSVPSFERVIATWNLEPEEAAAALTWLISLVTDAIRDGRRPGS
jgi:AcrR family transcriptional regulator